MNRSGPGRPKNSTRMSTRVLLVDADPALRGLMDEWLADAGYSVVTERPDLVVVDLPFSCNRCLEALWRVADAHPDVPIIALSSTFFPGIESKGAVARQLGVAAVLPKPLERNALLAAMRTIA